MENQQVGKGLKILCVDNYDSFVWTIVGYLRALGATVEVVRNDRVAANAPAQVDIDKIGGRFYTDQNGQAPQATRAASVGTPSPHTMASLLAPDRARPRKPEQAPQCCGPAKKWASRC